MFKHLNRFRVFVLIALLGALAVGCDNSGAADPEFEAVYSQTMALELSVRERQFDEQKFRYIPPKDRPKAFGEHLQDIAKQYAKIGQRWKQVVPPYRDRTRHKAIADFFDERAETLAKLGSRYASMRPDEAEIALKESEVSYSERVLEVFRAEADIGLDRSQEIAAYMRTKNELLASIDRIRIRMEQSEANE
jgi:hypothetical protein